MEYMATGTFETELSRETSSGSWDFISRDSHGDVVTAGRGRLDHVLDAFQAEVIACLQGLQEAINHGIGHMILETGAMLVIQATKENEVNVSAAGGVKFSKF
jgi:hypothetical protein